MTIDLITLGNAPRLFEFKLAPAEIALDIDEANVKTAVRVKAKLTKGLAQTNVDGEIDVELEVECARCLRQIGHNLQFVFSAVFVTAENYTQEKEAEINAKDLDVAIFEGDKIDFRELVREQILLNLPEQVFCQEDCLGLCEKCGANRNLINCNCIEKEIDPRWANLKDFRF